MLIIDSHHHFWQLQRGDYEWLTPKMTPLYQDFLPSDFRGILEQHSVAGTVLIQATQTLDETHYLLSLAAKTSFVKGVIGWVDVWQQTASDDLKTLAANPYFKGVRLVHGDLEGNGWPYEEAMHRFLQCLIEHHLVLELLIDVGQLDNARALAKRYPDLTIIINHFAKPDLDHGDFDCWAQKISQISHCQGVRVKMSGLLELAASLPSLEIMQPYFDHLFNAMTPQKILWGSNWPVLNAYADYEQWLSICQHILKTHQPTDQEAVLSQNAIDCYQLHFQ